MIPLFKSHYSIGKSILTYAKKREPKEDEKEELEDLKLTEVSSDSIIDLCIQNNIKNPHLVEDSMSGFAEAQKNFNAADIDFRFGLRVVFCSDSSDKESKEKTAHKNIIYPRSLEGLELMYKLATFINVDAREGAKSYLSYEDLKTFWDEDKLMLCVPFYDSFLYQNNLTLNSCVPDLSFINPYFFIEDNGLPIDNILKKKVIEFSNSKNLVKVKSIYYKNRSDFDAWLSYKCIANPHYRGRDLSSPNFDMCSSDEFSLESFLEQRNHG